MFAKQRENNLYTGSKLNKLSTPVFLSENVYTLAVYKYLPSFLPSPSHCVDKDGLKAAGGLRRWAARGRYTYSYHCMVAKALSLHSKMWQK